MSFFCDGEDISPQKDDWVADWTVLRPRGPWQFSEERKQLYGHGFR